MTACQTSKNRNLHLTNIDSLYLRTQAGKLYIKAEKQSKMGLHLQAIGSLNESLIFHPRSFFLRLRLVDEYLQVQQSLKAFELCKSLLEENPSHIEARLKMGKIYEMQHLYKKTFSEYEKILKDQSDHLETLYRVAFLHMSLEHFELARSSFLSLLQRYPENSHRIYYSLAEIDDKTKNWKRSRFYLQKSLFFQPLFIPSVITLSFSYRQSGDLKQAISTLEEYQKKFGFHPELAFSLVSLYYQTKDMDKAITVLTSLSEKYPQNLSLRLQLVSLLSQKTEYEKAILSLKEVITQRPTSLPRIHVLYASLFEEKKDYQGALHALQKASQVFPKNTEIIFYKGLIQDHLGQTSAVIKNMKEVLRINANHVPALNHLAFVYTELNQNLDFAEKIITKALSLSPKNVYVLDTAGWVLFKNGKTKKAVEYLEQAYKKDSSKSRIAEHLAEAYHQLNMIDKSIDLYEKAVSLERNERKKTKLQEKLSSIYLGV